MGIPEVSYLKQIGEFCVTYGPWAVAIFEGLFILKIMRDHKKERIDWETKRAQEREFTINRFQEYHDEIVKLVSDSNKSKTSMASKLLTNTKEVENVRNAVEQFFTLITEGIVKIKKAEIVEDTRTISDYMPETYIEFSATKKLDRLSKGGKKATSARKDKRSGKSDSEPRIVDSNEMEPELDPAV